MTELKTKGRTLINVSVAVVDEKGVTALSSDIEWFIVREDKSA